MLHSAPGNTEQASDAPNTVLVRVQFAHPLSHRFVGHIAAGRHTVQAVGFANRY
jgi:hypothetical protein